MKRILCACPWRESIRDGESDGDNDLIKSSLGGERYRNVGIETWMHFHDKHFARKRSPINSRSLSKSWENLKVKRSVYVYKMKEQKGRKKGIGEG